MSSGGKRPSEMKTGDDDDDDDDDDYTGIKCRKQKRKSKTNV